ncbi:MAG: hypothetical protein A3E87_06380 [Gammaproteobacteria bacterium RIFCSPHIGHO2_12_FULL_35_23]|nr:MAG: hypothetical protein A3E87_06380 [Gammaproteobacteria bacterium RIFCSPHIGHO2_12_FULL_35_23]
MIFFDFTSTKKLSAIFKIALSASLYGCLGYLGTVLLHNQMSTPAMLFWRFSIASLWMLPFLFKGMNIIKSTNKSMLLIIFIFGGICYSGCSGFYFLASQRIGTGFAMVIYFLYPVLIILFTWLFEREVISFGMFCAVIGVLIGLILLKGHSAHELNSLGIVFALLSAISYAAYVYGGQYIARLLPSHLLTLVVCLGCSFLFLLLAVLTHTWSYPVNLKMWTAAISLGVFSTALPIQLLLDGMKTIHSTKASMLSVLEPTVTVLLGVVLLRESFSFLQLIGVAIILISALAVQI